MELMCFRVLWCPVEWQCVVSGNAWVNLMVVFARDASASLVQFGLTVTLHMCTSEHHGIIDNVRSVQVNYKVKHEISPQQSELHSLSGLFSISPTVRGLEQNGYGGHATAHLQSSL